jgi:hypothetical protein
MIVYWETINGETWAVILDERGDVVERRLVMRRKAA